MTEVVVRAEGGNAGVAAVIVLYNPKTQLVDRLLTSVAGQVEKIIVVDNSPQPSPEYTVLLAVPEVVYHPLGKNTGIAAAQNIGIKRAMEEHCSHVLLLDQDSALPPKMVETLLQAESELIAQHQQVAAVGPIFVDEKTGELSPAVRHRFLTVRKIRINNSVTAPVEADYIIASGSLIRTRVFEMVGLMREELFIDWVDIEWGMRARGLGFRCFLIPKVMMKHSIGDVSVQFFRKTINLHNDVRNYYIVRNATFLLGLRTMGWQWRIITLFRIPRYILFYSLYSPAIFKSLCLLLKAVGDGLRGEVGPIK